MSEKIGVLALQGGFAAHARALAALGFTPVEVRTPAALEGLAGVVLPGGESTTQLHLLETSGLRGPLDAFVQSGRPVLATCAGLILAAREVVDPVQRSFGWIDATVGRNAYGRQSRSFEATDDAHRHPLLFIRAPRILAIGPNVEVLATLDGEPILIREGNVTAATFHPELTSDLTVHAAAFGAVPARVGPDG